MSNASSEIDAKLRRLMSETLDTILTKDVGIDQRLDAVKTIGGIYCAMSKIGGKKEADEDSEGAVISMAAMRDRVKAAGGNDAE